MALVLVAIGGILLLGIATDLLGQRTVLPRVTLLLALGILIGDQALGLIPSAITGSFEIITNVALMMVGFLLGGKLTVKSLRDDGRQLAWISLSAALGTVVIVAAILLLARVPLEIAILLGCIASATAPAATVDTVLESKSSSRFSRLLLAIVAIDDAWALVLFSLGLASVSLINGDGVASVTLLNAAREVFGAVLLGVLIGLPAAYLTGRLRKGQPMLTEALGVVFACGGLAMWLDVSFLIAVMATGAVIANFAAHHEYPFHEIENVEWPFMVIFFVVAGASLEVQALRELGVIGILYVFARVAGKLLGAAFGARVSGAEPAVRRWMGAALTPQAGVAIGMALLTSSRYPEYRDTILTVIIGTTVIFELIGPVLTRMALVRAAEMESD